MNKSIQSYYIINIYQNLQKERIHLNRCFFNYKINQLFSYPHLYIF